MSCCLAVDIGNTRISLGLCCGERVFHVRHLETGVSGRRKIREAITASCAGRKVSGSVLASVVPRSTSFWRRSLKDVFGVAPLVVDSRVELGVGISYPDPQSIGADRLANASGAAARYGVPVIVADFGTALTFDVIDGEGRYVGGVITPGLALMTDYLYEKTALLPRITLQGRRGFLGKNTREAMRIGAQIGYRGIVREIVDHLKKGLGARSVRLCATGGHARWALRESGMPFVFDKNLTLYGLGRIFRLNNSD